MIQWYEQEANFRMASIQHLTRQFQLCDKSLWPRAARAGLLISRNEPVPDSPSRQEPRPAMRQLPHVALRIETSRGYGRSLLQGVIRYQREHRPWSSYFQPHALGAPPPSWLKNWHGDVLDAAVQRPAPEGDLTGHLTGHLVAVLAVATAAQDQGEGAQDGLEEGRASVHAET
jgi:hypothetical protein